jgi:hypothetical protein
MKNMLDKQFLGSLITLIVGALFTIVGVIIDSNFVINGIVIILGALAYLSAKRRRLNMASHKSLWVILEILTLLAIAPITLLRNPQVLANNMILNLGIPFWILVAYVVVIPKPKFKVKESKPIFISWRNGDTLYSLILLVLTPVLYYSLTNLAFWLTSFLAPPAFVWDTCHRVMGDWPQCIRLLRGGYDLVTYTIFYSGFILSTISAILSFYFAIKSVRKTGPNHHGWSIDGIILITVSGCVSLFALVVLFGIVTGINLFEWAL